MYNINVYIMFHILRVMRDFGFFTLSEQFLDVMFLLYFPTIFFFIINLSYIYI